MPTGEKANYSKSCIYKLCCKDPTITDIYVGSTTNFTKRKYAHKCSCNFVNNKEYNDYKYQFIRDNGGWENWTMIQIKELCCISRRELETIERKYIEELQASLNKQLPLRSAKEWYEDNKQKIEKQKKVYYEENKQQIAEKKKEKIYCHCCKIFSNRSAISRHKKSKNHINNSANVIIKFFKKL